MTKPRERTDQASSPLRRRRSRLARVLVLIVGCVLIVDALVGDRGLLTMLEARADYRGAERDLAAIRAENARLRDYARRLREDPAAIEEIARREMGLLRPGEQLFIVKNISPTTDSGVPTPGPTIDTPK